LAICGVILLLLALGPLIGDREHGTSGATEDAQDPDGHSHGAIPNVAWLLLLPGLVTFVISPPPLGAYLAERRANDVTNATAVTTELGGAKIVPVRVEEFVWRAQADPDSLQGRSVKMTGFVSYDNDDNWYVTRMSISCCAADAVAFRVRVDEAETPERDQWVTVTGVWVEGSGATPRDPPALVADDVTPADPPKNTYE
jgi:uncharacterized repeat protein (TIGR03943 family)